MTHDLDQFYRDECVRLVRRFCRNTGTPHDQCWRMLYERLEAQTGFVAPDDDKKMLDHVQDAGLLDKLHGLAARLR